MIASALISFPHLIYSVNVILRRFHIRYAPYAHPTPPPTLTQTGNEIETDTEHETGYETADIPSLDLNGRVASPVSPIRSMSPVSSTGATGGGSGPPSRRTSFSSAGTQGGRSSTPGRGPGSGSSSRSTSFNLPNEAREVIRLDGRQPGDEIEVEEEMDEEGASGSGLLAGRLGLTGLVSWFMLLHARSLCGRRLTQSLVNWRSFWLMLGFSSAAMNGRWVVWALITAAAKHAAFVRARGRHYSNEAEAMKVRKGGRRARRCGSGHCTIEL